MAVEVASSAANAVSVAVPGMAQVPQSLALVIEQFLDDWHYRILSTTLAERWQSKRTLSSAVALLRHHGVELTVEEETELMTLTDDEIVEKLVSKVPTQSGEHFKVFFLQLQIVVETVSRLRKALEDGQADAVEAAMDDAESAGVLQYILRQTVVHTGQELVTMKNIHTGWLKDTEAKMARMLKAHQEAMASKHLLLEAQEKLKNMGALQRRKAYGALSAVANDRDAQILKVALAGWQMTIRNEKSEATLKSEHERLLQESNERLQAFRVKQLSSVHGVMQNKIGQNSQQLMGDVFSIWLQESTDLKMQKVMEEERRKAEHQMKVLQDAQAKIARQVMERMTGATGLDLCKLCITSWVEEVGEIKRSRMSEADMMAMETKLKLIIDARKVNAQSVLSQLSKSVTEDIMNELFFAWQMKIVEERRVRHFANKLSELELKTKNISIRTKQAASFVMTRVVVNFDTMRTLRCLSSWIAVARMERLKHFYDGKIDTKRHQLQSVQNLFREFAGRLETGIIKSPREDGYKRDSGGVVLPELAPSSASGNGRLHSAPLGGRSASQSSLRKDRPQSSQVYLAGGAPSVSIRAPPQPVRDDSERLQDRGNIRRDSREPSTSRQELVEP